MTWQLSVGNASPKSQRTRSTTISNAEIFRHDIELACINAVQPYTF